MATLDHTTRINLAWLQKTCAEVGGVKAFADIVGVDQSTVYKHLTGNAKLGPDFQATIVARFPVKLADIAEVVPNTPTQRRTYRTAS